MQKAETQIKNMPDNTSLISTSPSGETFNLPQESDYESEFSRLKVMVNEQRLMGRQIVVVMGVGFVGAVMAGVIADSMDRRSGNSNKFLESFKFLLIVVFHGKRKCLS